MERWAKNILGAFSLLVFLLSVTLWVRSYFVAEQIEGGSRRMDPDGQPPLSRSVAYKIILSHGDLAIAREREVSRRSTFPPLLWAYDSGAPVEIPIESSTFEKSTDIHLGRFLIRRAVGSNEDGWGCEEVLLFPLWLLFPTAIPPALWWRRWRRKSLRGFEVQTTAAGAGEIQNH